jgi:hypothetical protein
MDFCKNFPRVQAPSHCAEVRAAEAQEGGLGAEKETFMPNRACPPQQQQPKKQQLQP